MENEETIGQQFNDILTMVQSLTSVYQTKHEIKTEIMKKMAEYSDDLELCTLIFRSVALSDELYDILQLMVKSTVDAVSDNIQEQMEGDEDDD